MCLPLGCLKGFIKFNSVIVVLMGIASLITGIIIGVETGGSTSVFFTSGLDFSKNGLTASLYVFGVYCCILGICGYYGGKNKSKCLLLLFDIGVGGAFLAFFAVGIASSVLTAGVSEDNNLSRLKFKIKQKDSCMTSSWSQGYYNASTDAVVDFCQPSCPCYVANTTFSAVQYAELSLLYTFTDNNTAPTQYDECSNYQQQDQYDLLSAAETVFGCSGWCSRQDIYFYTNVNDGTPMADESCFFSLFNWLHDYGAIFATVSLLIAFMCFLIVMASFCICCHPEVRNKGGDYYERMGYYDGQQ